MRAQTRSRVREVSQSSFDREREHRAAFSEPASKFRKKIQEMPIYLWMQAHVGRCHDTVLSVHALLSINTRPAERLSWAQQAAGGSDLLNFNGGASSIKMIRAGCNEFLAGTSCRPFPRCTGLFEYEGKALSDGQIVLVVQAHWHSVKRPQG